MSHEEPPGAALGEAPAGGGVHLEEQSSRVPLMRDPSLPATGTHEACPASNTC